MSKYADIACCAVLSVVVLVIASTFGVAHLDYQSRFEEYSEHVAEARKWHKEHCLDTKLIADLRPRAREALTMDCHEAKHAAYDEPGQRALHDVMSRWAVCDESGCAAVADRFSRYFAIFAFVLALVVGAISVGLIRRTSSRRFIETLPEAVRRDLD